MVGINPSFIARAQIQIFHSANVKSPHVYRINCCNIQSYSLLLVGPKKLEATRALKSSKLWGIDHRFKYQIWPRIKIKVSCDVSSSHTLQVYCLYYFILGTLVKVQTHKQGLRVKTPMNSATPAVRIIT